MTKAERILHEAHLRFQRESGAVLPDLRKNNVLFQEPQSETWIKQHRTYRPQGFYRLHCSHDRPLWMQCVTCKRGGREANSNLVKLLTSKLV
jgi:hypothetical protein